VTSLINSKLSGPWRITFDTNPDDCNLHCIMCERFSEYNIEKKLTKMRKRMPPSLIKQVVFQGFQMGELKEIIPSTMGEPLLYKDFDIFINLCRDYNLKLNLTTNSTFPRRSSDEWAEILLPICSDIKISWNGYFKETDESIMRGRDHEKAKENLLTLIRKREELQAKGVNCSSITLQMTFLEMNYKEIPDIIKFAIRIGIDRIKGHHLWIHYQETEDLSMRRNADSIERWNKVAIESNEIAKKTKNTNGKKIKLENIYPLSSKEDKILSNSVCPFLGREAWVSAEGVFSPCCAPDELRKRLGDFGNLNDRTLEEIWNSPEYNNLCKNYNQFKLCQTCNMRKKPQEVYKYGFEEN